MHNRSNSLHCGLAALVLVGAAHARGLEELPPPAAPADTAMVVWLAPGCAPQEIVDLTGARLVGSMRHANVHLFELEAVDDVLSSVKSHVGELPITVDTDWDRRVKVPEGTRCAIGAAADVAAEQCTIAFVDGNPSLSKFSEQEALEAVHASGVQDFSAGVPVIVAVIDTGIDPGHFVFDGQLAGFGWDYITERAGGFDVTNGRDDDHDGNVDESYGHGTHVAGTVLAFDPAAHILPMRVLDADGSGSAFALARAIEDSVDAGASFINLSLSVTEPSLPVAIALHHAWKHGVAVFTSAGNLGKQKVLFPGNFSLGQFPVFARRISNDIPRGFDPVVTVSSVNDHDVKSSFASWGPEVDLVAPGEGIYSAFPGNRVAWWSGTSMACAVATGCASLLLSSGFTHSAPPVVKALVDTGHSVNWQNPAYWGMLGAGRINVWHANMELWHDSH